MNMQSAVTTPLQRMETQRRMVFYTVFGICPLCRLRVTSHHENSGVPIRYDTYGNPLHPLTCEHVFMTQKKLS